jgi:tetratricopeptide (TPR) repeat protein
MPCVRVFSTLVLKRALDGLLPAQGVNTAALASCSDHLARALRQANARAWVAVEILLGGQRLWERAQLTWERQLEGEFFQPLRFLLNTTSLGDLASEEARRKTWQALCAARESGLLTSGSLEAGELLARCAGTEAADALTALAAELNEAGFAELRPLLQLRSAAGDPLLVVLTAALFHEAIASDPDLFAGFLAMCPRVADAAIEPYRPVALALERHRVRLEVLLQGLQPAPAAPAAAAEAHAAGGPTRGPVLAAVIYIQRGDAHRINSEYAEALADYTTALGLEPANVAVLVQRGQVQLLLGNKQEAIADFTAALRLDPNHAQAHCYRGKALADLGDLDEAIGDFTEALRLDPQYAWAHHYLGEVHAARKSYDRALAGFSEALRLNALVTISHLRRGDVYAQRREFERAIADYNNALQLDPRNALAYLGRGAAYRELGKLEPAESDLTRALELDGANPRILFERGVLFQQQGNHGRALLDFNAAVAHQADFTEAYFRRALSHEALGDAERELADFAEVLRLDPSHAACYYHRGQLSASLGQVELALEDFSAAVRLEPYFVEAYLGRAKVLARVRKFPEALADCDQAVGLNPNLGDVFLVRGSILGQQGRFAAALQSFSRALKLGLHSAPVFFLRGMACLKLNNTSQALADLTNAIRLDPQHARAYAQRAAVRLAAGEADLAISDLAQATCLDRQYAVAFCNLVGQLQENEGRQELAAAFFTLTRLFDPAKMAARGPREHAGELPLHRIVRPPKGKPRTGGVLSSSSALVSPRPGRPRRASETDAAIKWPLRAGETDAVIPVPPADDNTTTATAGDEDGEARPATNGVTNKKGPQPAAKPSSERTLSGESNTAFELNIPRKQTHDDQAAAAGERPAPEPHNEPAEEEIEEEIELDEEAEEEAPPQHAPKELPEDTERRARLATEFRHAEEKRKQQEAQEAARKARQKKKHVNDDDDERMPLWKKGLGLAASLVILYMAFGAVRQIAAAFHNPLAEDENRTPVAKLSVAELCKRYAGKTASADNHDEVLEVTGIFTHFQGGKDGQGINLCGDSAKQVASCTLVADAGPRQTMFLSRMTAGARVTVRGKFAGVRASNVLMNECRIVDVIKARGF